jgi:hypothetical protein
LTVVSFLMTRPDMKRRFLRSASVVTAFQFKKTTSDHFRNGGRKSVLPYRGALPVAIASSGEWLSFARITPPNGVLGKKTLL